MEVLVDWLINSPLAGEVLRVAGSRARARKDMRIYVCCLFPRPVLPGSPLAGGCLGVAGGRVAYAA
jgi:hypothetical protein